MDEEAIHAGLKSVGIQVWDSDHNIVLDQINKLQNTDPSAGEIKQLMISLLHFAEIHLRSEERMMQELGYPDLESHKQEHDKFRQWFKEQNQLRLRAPEDWDNQKVSCYLRNWWTSHIQEVDMAYKDFFAARMEEVQAHLDQHRSSPV